VTHVFTYNSPITSFCSAYPMSAMPIHDR